MTTSSNYGTMALQQKHTNRENDDTQFSRTINELRNQNDALTEVSGSLNSLIDRLDGVANRLNSVGYSKPPNVTLAQDGLEKDLPVDGLMADFRSVIDNRAQILNGFRNVIIPNFEEAIIYLEKHI